MISGVKLPLPADMTQPTFAAKMIERMLSRSSRVSA